MLTCNLVLLTCEMNILSCTFLCWLAAFYVDMHLCDIDLRNKYVHAHPFGRDKLHVNRSVSHVDINKMHVNRNKLHVDVNKLPVDTNTLHVDIDKQYLSC